MTHDEPVSGSRPAPLLIWLVYPLLGLVATAGHAPFDQFWLSILALAALMWLLRDATPRRAGLAVWLFGIAHFVSGLYWIWISTHVHGGAPAWLSVIVVIGLSVYLAAFGAIAASLAQRQKNLALRWLVYWPALLVLAELMRGWLLSGFPWLSWGYIALDTPWANFAAIAGVHGLSLLVVLAAGLLASAAHHFQVRQTRPAVLIAAALVLVATTFLPSPSRWTKVVGELDAALIQGNVPQELKWRQEQRLPTLDLYRDLTLPVLDQRLVIWPEVAVTIPLAQLQPRYFADLDAQANAAGSTILAGVLDRYPDSVYNAVTALGRDSGLYHKQHLVPFGEYFPIPDFVRPLMDFLSLPVSDLRAGRENQPLFQIDGRKIGLSICFEDVFGNEFRQRFGGAPMLINITNDAWFNDSSAAHQHLAIARMRAMENGKELLRVANTGITARITADGELAESLTQFSRSVLVVSAQWRQGQTPYAQFGDWPVWLLCLGALLGLSIYNRRKSPD